MFNYKTFVKYEKYYKRILKRYFDKKDYNNFLKTAKFYCTFEHSINQRMVDFELENMLGKVSENMFGTVQLKPDKRNIVLYDSIGTDNIALSKQYLFYLIDRNEPFTYILIKSENNSELVKAATDCSICNLILLDNNCMEHIAKVRKAVLDSLPDKLILHMSNSDVYGFIALSGIDGVEKYYINHGYEQFWVGAKLLDYCVEFRSRSFDISSRLRSIDSDKIVLQPYYPIITEHDFKGLDLDQVSDGKVRLFSGGRFVKAYGRDMAFLKMVGHILELNPNVCFFFAGSGNSTSMRKFISNHQLENRWFIIPYRKDLYEVMKRMDIYVSTYPMWGGLMSQTAAVAGLPILELDSHMVGSSADVLTMLDGYAISCNSLQEYYLKAQALINDEIERKRVGEIMKKSVITREIFFRNFTEILEDGYSSFSFKNDVFNFKFYKA